VTGIVKRVWRHFRTRSAQVALGSGSLLEAGFALDIRTGPTDNRVVVGTNSIIQCRVTLERQIGKITIGDNTFIGASHLICAQEIRIGSDVLIAWGCTIVDHNSHSIIWSERQTDVKRWRDGLLGNIDKTATNKNWDVVPMGPIQIEDKAWVGFNSIILKNVIIGEGAVIGAGSVVTKSVPPWCIVAGNPAHIIREMAEHERQ
jgi:acetyltransferase-like isoleucine patch superfamily enzyme